MANQLANTEEYVFELYPGYEVKLKPRYVYDERTATMMMHVPIDLSTPDGDVKLLLMTKETTFKALVKTHGNTALRLMSLVKSHFSSFRPMMRRSQVGL